MALRYRESGVTKTVATIDDVNAEGDGRHVPVGVVWMFDGSNWVDNSTIPGWYACIAANSGQGCPDMVDRFVMGKVVAGSGATGGTNSYQLTVGQLPSHDHTISAYSGTFASGNPSVNHTHSVSASTGSESANHNHGISAHGSVCDGSIVARACSNPFSVTNSTGGRSTAHGHSFSTTSGTVSAWHTHDTTVSFNTKNTGSTGSGNSIDNRPAFYSMIFIRKCA